eukprot:Sspe_Gene.78833::Locus_49354_Transcript_2_2_Confidence_0.667_Length_646::g.78833::m.78833
MHHSRKRPMDTGPVSILAIHHAFQSIDINEGGHTPPRRITWDEDSMNIKGGRSYADNVKKYEAAQTQFPIWDEDVEGDDTEGYDDYDDSDETTPAVTTPSSAVGCPKRAKRTSLTSDHSRWPLQTIG